MTPGGERRCIPWAHYIILWAGFLLFCIAAAYNIRTNPINDVVYTMDEQGHLSYALDLIQHHRWWPDFSDFMMYNVPSKPNYINHPPTFYWLAKLLHAFHPAITVNELRLSMLPFAFAAMLLYTLLGLRLCRSLLASLLYAMVPFLVNMQFQVGFYNNDCMAILGGMIVAWASLDWLETIRSRRAFWWMLAGLAFASVKLTSLMLVGLYALACVWQNPTARRLLARRDWFLTLLACILMVLPYLYLIYLTGSPVPETAGQVAFMTHNPPGDTWSRHYLIGWVQEPRLHFLPWLLVFFEDLDVQWSHHNLAFIPLLLIVAGFAIATLRRSGRTPLRQAIVACAVATSITLICNIAFSWPRYIRFGWLLDSNVRYYFPLIGIYSATTLYVIETFIRRKTA
jgi:hypothetical protein